MPGLLLVASGCDEVFTPEFTYGSVDVSINLPDGRGVPHVPLVLYTGTRHLAYANTDSSGAAHFDKVPEGPAGVGAAPVVYVAEDETYYVGVSGGPEAYYKTIEVSEGDRLRVEFQYEDSRGSIAVQVLDETSQPVSGLNVELYTTEGVLIRQTLPESGSLLFSKLSQKDYAVRVLGSATCPLPPDGFVHKDGLIVGPGEDLEIEFVLPSPCVYGNEPGSIGVQVLDEASQPVSGLNVELYTGGEGTLAVQTLPESGLVLFPELGIKDYGVRVLGSATCPLPPDGFVHKDGLIVGPGEDLEIEFVLPSPCVYGNEPGSIGVQVLDEASQPVSGLNVELYTGEGTLAVQTLPESGLVVFSQLGPGDYGVRVLGSATCPLLPDGFVHKDGLIVGPGQDLEVEFVLPSPCDPLSSIGVQVLDEASQPVSGLNVELYTGEGTLAVQTLPESGLVVFSQLGPGDYGVRVLGSATCPLLPDGFVHKDGLIVGPGEDLEIEFVLPSPCDPPSSIGVQVLDEASQPVSGLNVELYTGEGTLAVQTLPESGLVVFSQLGPGDYGVRVLGSATCPLLPDGFVHKDGLIVGPGEDLEIEFVLPPC